MAGDAALMCYGVVLVVILTFAYLLGVVLGRALRAHWENRREALDKRYEACPRPQSRPLPPGPLWQNNRLYEEQYTRRRTRPREEYDAASGLPEGIRRERPRQETYSSDEYPFR